MQLYSVLLIFQCSRRNDRKSVEVVQGNAVTPSRVVVDALQVLYIVQQKFTEYVHVLNNGWWQLTWTETWFSCARLFLCISDISHFHVGHSFYFVSVTYIVSSDLSAETRNGMCSGPEKNPNFRRSKFTHPVIFIFSLRNPFIFCFLTTTWHIQNEIYSGLVDP